MRSAEGTVGMGRRTAGEELLNPGIEKAGQAWQLPLQMRLPNADEAIVEREKIVGYLLNPAHRYGASKARFFARFGFQAEDWEQLAQALRDHGHTQEVKRVHETGFGPRYEVEGRLIAPDGRSPRVRSVWQMDRGEVAPRLITAYPLED